MSTVVSHYCVRCEMHVHTFGSEELSCRQCGELIHEQPRRVCEYCEEAPADGYVAAYRAHVCRECYEDHHGPVDC